MTRNSSLRRGRDGRIVDLIAEWHALNAGPMHRSIGHVTRRMSPLVFLDARGADLDA
jgi:hypothetical protein